MTKKTFLLRNVGFGDILWSEPIVRHFLQLGHRVDVHTVHPCVYANYPSRRLDINRIENIFPLQEDPIALNLWHHPETHILDGFRRTAGVPDMPLSYPQLHLSREEKKRSIRHEYVILHLDKYDCSRNFRNIYGVDWKEVVAFLRSQHLDPIQISKRGTHLVTKWITTKDFREVMSLVHHCKAFIGLDSGPSHIAASMRIPSVIFFGSVNPFHRHIDNHRKVFLQTSCEFAHCYHKSVPPPACRLLERKKHPPCCVYETKQVIEAIQQILSMS